MRLFGWRHRVGRRARGLRAAALVAALASAVPISALSPWIPEGVPAPGGQDRPIFKEIWAYVLQGEEKELSGTEPITDVGYFGVNLTNTGRITQAVARPAIILKDGFKPRIHLVVAELSNYALMHFSLDPQYGVMPQLVQDICRVSVPFDGVQIDFEAISRDDADFFIDFLRELRTSLPFGKVLSVAVPARTQGIADAYDYTRIAPLVDRLIIMAYDEHWSTSSPGPVASLPWCSKVADYARSVVESGKVVMGLPLYGRAWQDKKLARALRFESVQDLVTQTNSTPVYAPELGAHFEYSENVVVSVFYDDERTILDKLQLYRARGIESVSFWRVGLGPPQLWGLIDHASPQGALPEAAATASQPAPGATAAPLSPQAQSVAAPSAPASSTPQGAPATP